MVERCSAPRPLALPAPADLVITPLDPPADKAHRHVARLAAYLKTEHLPRYLGLVPLSASAELDTLSELLRPHGLRLRWRDRRYQDHALVFADALPDTPLPHTKGSCE